MYADVFTPVWSNESLLPKAKALLLLLIGWHACGDDVRGIT